MTIRYGLGRKHKKAANLLIIPTQSGYLFLQNVTSIPPKISTQIEKDNESVFLFKQVVQMWDLLKSWLYFWNNQCCLKFM